MADVKDAQATEPVAQAAEPKKETTPTVEELQAQIKALESERDKLKQANTAASSDAADWKRKYRETLDEATRKEQERTEREEAIAKQLEEYKAKDRIATYQSKLIEAGFDVETASKMAADLPEGVNEAFFASQKEFLAKQEQAVKSKMLNDQTGLSTGTPPTAGSAVDEETEKLRRWARGY